jgi:hypothetical protein
MADPLSVARIIALEAGLVAFRELMDERDKRYTQRSIAQDTAVAAALATSKEAVTKAEVATEKRLETLNELRQVVLDQSKDFARSSEMKLIIDAIEKRIAALAEAVGANTARGGGIKDMIGYLVGVGGLGIAALAVYLHR